jgi:hypothetical protein
MEKISPKKQLEIFEAMFLYMIEKPSMRWQLLKMIESRDRVDNAELNLQLRKLELEIMQENNKGGGNE